MGYVWERKSRTERVETINLDPNVAPCGETVTGTKNIEGDYRIIWNSISVDIPVIGYGFKAGYKIGVWNQFRKVIKKLSLSHTCTGGPEFDKLIVVDVKREYETWELWDRSWLWDTLILTVELFENPLSIVDRRCVDNRKCKRE